MNDTQQADPLAEIFGDFDPFETEPPAAYDAWDSRQRARMALGYIVLCAVVTGLFVLGLLVGLTIH